MTDHKVATSLKRFLLTEQHCPPEWENFDLYIFRDDAVVFYVGQSRQAFARVWEHLLGGFHGHSMMGRFVWANWPVSMKFAIELLSSDNQQFAHVGNDLSAAERLLIQQLTPCFNISLNSLPSPIPPAYRPANAPLRCARSLTRLTYEAQKAVNAEDQRLWLDEIQN